MKESGTVIEVKNGIASVEVARSAACEHCKACHLGRDAQIMVAEAQNDAQAEVGDKVYIELEQKIILGAAVIVYIIPLLFLIIGYLIGSNLANWLGVSYNEEIGVAFGFSLLALSYIIVWYINKRLSITRTFEPKLTEIIKKSGGS